MEKTELLLCGGVQGSPARSQVGGGQSSVRNRHLDRDPKDEEAEGAACAKSLWQEGGGASEAMKACQPDPSSGQSPLSAEWMETWGAQTGGSFRDPREKR